MKIVKVSGNNKKHRVFIYAISTCAWCKATKQFLKDSDVEYEYVDVDLCDDGDRERIRDDIINRGGRPSYPILIIDDKSMIVGFRKEEIKEALGI